MENFYNYQSLSFLTFGFMVLFFLGIGLRGLLGRKPFIMPARWMFAFVLVCFSPSLFVPLFSIKSGCCPIAQLTPSLIIFFIIYIVWKQLQGYMVLGVTDASMREALLGSLKKLGIAYEETLSVLKLSGGGELRVTVYGSMGSAFIQGHGFSDPAQLVSIAREVGRYFQENPVETNRVIFVLYTIIGVLMCAVLLSLGTMTCGLGRSSRICRVGPVQDINRGQMPPGLTNPRAVERYRGEYLAEKDHKAFAMSLDGPFGYCFRQRTVEQARTCALDFCEKYCKEGQAPCLVVSVDGELVP